MPIAAPSRKNVSVPIRATSAITRSPSSSAKRLRAGPTAAACGRSDRSPSPRSETTSRSSPPHSSRRWRSQRKFGKAAEAHVQALDRHVHRDRFDRHVGRRIERLGLWRGQLLGQRFAWPSAARHRPAKSRAPLPAALVRCPTASSTRSATGSGPARTGAARQSASCSAATACRSDTPRPAADSRASASSLRWRPQNSRATRRAAGGRGRPDPAAGRHWRGPGFGRIDRQVERRVALKKKQNRGRAVGVLTNSRKIGPIALFEDRIEHAARFLRPARSSRAIQIDRLAFAGLLNGASGQVGDPAVAGPRYAIDAEIAARAAA